MSDLLDMQHPPGQPACVKWLRGAARQASTCMPGKHITCKYHVLESFVSVSAKSTPAAKAPPSASRSPPPIKGFWMLQELPPCWAQLGCILTCKAFFRCGNPLLWLCTLVDRCA